jgi:hypothetical protein
LRGNHWVARDVRDLDFSGLATLAAVAFDGTASKRGHNSVTVFIDADRKSEQVIFATPGKGHTNGHAADVARMNNAQATGAFFITSPPG